MPDYRPVTASAIVTAEQAARINQLIAQGVHLSAIAAAVRLPASYIQSLTGYGVAAPKVDPPPTPAYALRHGLVRVVSRGLVDADGPLPALGVTLFPAAWAEKNDPARLDREFQTIAAAGCYHFYRSGTGFAGETWADRMADPRDLATVAAMAERGATYGLRAMHCLFMDGAASPGMETQAARIAVVDACAEMLRGREHLFLAIEICNELDNGDKIPMGDARELAIRLRAKTPVPVILSRVVFDRYAEMYAGTGLALATAHLEREDSADGGAWEHLSKANEFPPDGPPADPTAWMSGEPKGPGSSGKSEYNVLRLVMGYVCTLVEGMAGHVFHTGPGLRLGGFWDRPDHRTLDGRVIPEHLADLPEWSPVSAGFKAAQGYLPADLPNWQRWRGHWGDNPINFIPYRHGGDNGPFDDGTLFKAYTVARGNQVLAVALRVTRPIQIAHRTHPCVFEVLDPVTGSVLTRETHGPGEWMTIEPRPADGWNPDGDGLVIRGTLL